MTRPLGWALQVLLVVGLTAGPAAAMNKGASLYAGPLGATVRAKASGKAASVAHVSAGDALTWLGAAPEDRRFQRVQTSDGKEGFVALGEVVLRKPQVEPPAQAASAEPKPFAAQGFVKCRLTPEAAQPGPEGARLREVAAALATAHAVARGVTLEAAVAYVAARTGGAR